MPSADTHQPRITQDWGLARQSVLLFALLLLAAALTAPVGWYLDGTSGLIAALLASLFCLAGGLATLAACRLCPSEHRALFAVAIGMLLRTSIPLVLALAVRGLVPGVFAAGLLYFVLIDYLVCLAVETWLLATGIEHPPAREACDTSRLNVPRRASGIS
ncbi:MAG: hypothetical protein R3C10_27915 [Pirellulales bacterium]|nr:hypothetical protein [Planctomycetales bacterium]